MLYNLSGKPSGIQDEVHPSSILPFCQGMSSFSIPHGKDAGSKFLLSEIAEAAFLFGLQRRRYIEL